MQNRESLFEKIDRVAAKNRVAHDEAMKDFRESFTLGETARQRKEREEKELLRLDVLEMLG